MSDLIKRNNKLTDSKGNISENLLNELFNPTFDLSIDYSEIFIDDIISNETIKEIPVIRSIVGIVKGGIAINQFWFAKKLLIFIQNFNNKEIEKSALVKFKKKIETNDRFGKKVAEQLMVNIDRNIEIKQTQIIANLFRAYVSEKITYEQFSSILITLDRLNPKAYSAFFALEKIDFDINESNHKEIGARDFELESLISIGGFAIKPSSWFSGFKLTDDGAKLFEFGIKPLK